ncbi:MAG: hypothetical protein C5B52_00230 [Bacteroidetes bacterium]|nr:MAG: hypothetical protein C5B52_00230 [Bacteroidota bacterium]
MFIETVHLKSAAKVAVEKEIFRHTGFCHVTFSIARSIYAITLFQTQNVMSKIASNVESVILQMFLVLAPLFFATSTFYWKGGEYSIISGLLIIISMFFWLGAFRALFSLLAVSLPRYSVWGMWMAYFGCISGVCFGFLGYLSSAFGISHQQYLEVLSKFPVSSQILLLAPDPSFRSVYSCWVFNLPEKKRYH